MKKNHYSLILHLISLHFFQILTADPQTPLPPQDPKLGHLCTHTFFLLSPLQTPHWSVGIILHTWHMPPFCNNQPYIQDSPIQTWFGGLFFSQSNVSNFFRWVCENLAGCMPLERSSLVLLNNLKFFSFQRKNHHCLSQPGSSQLH